MKKILLSALALMAMGAMCTEAEAQFRVVKDGTALLVMEEGAPDYVSFDNDDSEEGHITLERLLEMTSVTVDKTAEGKNGNVITCKTAAPVNAQWTIAEKSYTYNSFSAKVDVGEYTVLLSAMCADGTKLNAQFAVSCDEITASPIKHFIYGEDPEQEPPFSPGSWYAAAMRFSDKDGKHFPSLSDDIYWGFKTLIFDISDASAGCKVSVMNGWWAAIYADVELKDGLFEVPITERIAKDCASGHGGDGMDLMLMLTSGSCTVNSVYYETEEVVLDEKKSADIAGIPVDMGLSVKWSSVNVGASKPEEAGNYYAWGELKPKSVYSLDNYKGETAEFIGDNKTVLDKEDDAAAVNWQGDWVMPTIDDWDELQKYCTFEWTNNYKNGTRGLIIKSKKDGNTNSIFIPAVGFMSGSLSNESIGYYWSSSLDKNYSDRGRNVWFFDTGYFGTDSWSGRYNCQPVRSVCPAQGNTNGHDAVDLGLPSGKLWATCNVGASAPEESGSYFAWGETEAKSDCWWDTYKHMQSGQSNWYYINKYQSNDYHYDGTWYRNVKYKIEGGKTILDAADDVATQNWGEEWRMPTQAEWQELYDNTTHEWTDSYFGSGVSGYILTSTIPGHENAYIFLPAAGYQEDSDLSDDVPLGYYWSSSLYEYSSDEVQSVAFGLGRFRTKDFDQYRYKGLPIRPVCISIK